MEKGSSLADSTKGSFVKLVKKKLGMVRLCRGEESSSLLGFLEWVAVP